MQAEFGGKGKGYENKHVPYSPVCAGLSELMENFEMLWSLRLPFYFKGGRNNPLLENGRQF